MSITDSYRSLSPDLKDAMAAHGSEHPCRSHLLGSMCFTKTLAPLFFSKRAETIPYIQPMGQQLILKDPGNL